MAWLTFDKINQYNDTTKVVDLNCLEIKDALNIVYAKIHEVAQIVSDKFNEGLKHMTFAQRSQIAG